MTQLANDQAVQGAPVAAPKAPKAKAARINLASNTITVDDRSASVQHFAWAKCDKVLGVMAPELRKAKGDRNDAVVRSQLQAAAILATQAYLAACDNSPSTFLGGDNIDAMSGYVTRKVATIKS